MGRSPPEEANLLCTHIFTDVGRTMEPSCPSSSRPYSALPTILPSPMPSPLLPILAELDGEGVLEALAGGLRLSRRGGYTGLPLVVFALVFLSARAREGLRPFWTRFKRPLKRVAAVAGLTALPSSGSVSRALGKISAATADQFADVALSLQATPALAQVLSHPSVVHRDSRGDGLHVIDIDPSVQAYRLRDLVESDDHPEPERLAPGVAGYTGHHRGEVRIRHVAVCHAGAGVWLSYQMSENNPRLSVFFSGVLSPAIRVLEGANVAASQILVRGDAEFGSAGVARAIVDLGVQLLVRIARYRLLDRPEVQQTLQVAAWEEVVLGGVRVREAAELGMIMLHPSSKSADAGGSGILLRVVVARRKVEASTVTYGTLRDGHQYELFATTLSADAWSPADIVELYAGRSAIENRFAQEDRELDLGRTFSYHAPGQAVFTAIGLSLWNHWTCAGFLASPPAVVSEATPRKPRPEVPAVPVDNSPAALAVVAVAPVQPDMTAPQPDAQAVHDSPDNATALAVVGVAPVQPVHDRPAATATEPSPRSDPMDPFPGADDDERDAMVVVLRSAYRDQLQVPHWSIDPVGFLRCPNGKRLFPFCIAKVGKGRPRPQVMIRTDVGACDGCPHRTECYASSRPNTYKQISRSIAPAELSVVSAFLARHPPGRTARSIRPRPPEAPPEPPSEEPTTAALPTTELVGPPPPATIGPWTVLGPTFAAAAARERARARHAHVRVEIRISRRRRARVASADLRRTRRSWAQRDDRWRLDACVHLTLLVPRQPPKKRPKDTLHG